jgi:hypothetical protein
MFSGTLWPSGGRRIVLLLGVGGIARYIHFWLSQPIGQGPAGPVVPRAAFGNIWTERPVLLLGMGDRVTAGLSARAPDPSDFNRLMKNLNDEFPEMQGLSLSAVMPNLTTRNLAISGTTSLTYIDVLKDRLKTPILGAACKARRNERSNHLLIQRSGISSQSILAARAATLMRGT